MSNEFPAWPTRGTPGAPSAGQEAPVEGVDVGSEVPAVIEPPEGLLEGRPTTAPDRGGLQVLSAEAGEVEVVLPPESVSPKVRRVMYFVGLGWNFLGLIAVGLAAVLLGADSPTALALAAGVGVVSTAYGTLTGALNVAYRPIGK
ncbi:hypothetical protein D3C74_257270 [compost metagenome]